MKRVIVALLLVCSMTGCVDKKRGMEARTYELVRLKNDEAMALLTPYIREGGYISGKDRYITVREKPDRLNMITDLLKKYDGIGEAVDVVMEIQVIQADGVAQRDPAIADVEETLRQMFKYQGYKLVGSTIVRTREDADFGQTTQSFSVSGHVQRVRVTGNDQRVAITIVLRTPKGDLQSTVTATIGKPVVLGQTTGDGAMILVVRPTIAKS